jgi:hypothetical protein
MKFFLSFFPSLESRVCFPFSSPTLLHRNQKSVGPPRLRPQHLLVRQPPLLVRPRRRLPPSLPQLPAPRHGAPFFAALLRVHLQQHPHPSAELAAAVDPQGAGPGVLEKGFHLGAITGSAAGVGAARGVPQQRHRPRQLRRALGPLGLGQPRPRLVKGRAASGRAPGVRRQRVGVPGGHGVEAAGGAHVEVGADGAAEAT